MHSIANTPLWALIFWASFYAWFFIFETWVSIRDMRAKATLGNTDRRSAFFVLIALYVGVISAILFSFLAPQFRIDPSDSDLSIFITGIGIMWSGVLFRFWSIQTLGKYFRTLVQFHDDHLLITSGPYQYLRHPSYTGSIISVLGMGIALGNWMSLISVVLAVILGYTWRISVEETALKARFGAAYDEYSKRTSRIIPFVW